ncbi:MAG: YeeE/YedE thiosulfate transporter family protein, partial [Candidatus Bathyarchaeia archaeon]
ERGWRLALALGLIVGAFIYTAIFSGGRFYTTSISIIRLVIGGFLVGLGTRLSGGCTSGHGISGLASLSTTSAYAVLTFMGTAILTANIMQLMGVTF